MTYTSSSTAAIAVAASKAERRVVQALRDAGALAADQASPVTPRRPFDPMALRRLVRAGAVHKVAGGYWLDEAAYAAMTERRRGVACMVLVAAAVAAIVLVAIALAMRAG